MRTLTSILVATALMAPLVTAGEEEKDATAARVRRPSYRRSGPMGDELSRMRVPRSTAMEIARSYFVDKPEDRDKLQSLETAYQEEGRKKMVEVIRELDKKFGEQAAQIMPEEEKEKYQKVLAAENERLDAIQAARKEFEEFVNSVRGGQDDGSRMRYPPSSLSRKGVERIINACIDLSDDQRKQLDELRLDRIKEQRNARNALERPKDRRDYKAQRDYWQKVREEREKVREQFDKAMLDALTQEQKETYDAVLNTMDTRDAKIEAANVKCDTKLVEILGEDRLYPGRTPGRPRPRPE